jgi:hypothetical protein
VRSRPFPAIIFLPDVLLHTAHQEIFYELETLLESDRAPETHRVLRSPRSVAELRGDSGQTLALN